MPKLKDLKLRPPRIIIYGIPGTGKTALGLTGGARVLALDVDGGMRTGLTLQDKFHSERLEVEVKDCFETNPFIPTSFGRVLSFVKSFAQECRAGKPPAKILMIDSWTSVCMAAQDQVAAQNNRVGQKLRKIDWLDIISMLTGLSTLIRTCPAVVIMTAHQMYVYGGEEEKPENATASMMCVGTKLPSIIIGAFDELWHVKTIDAAGGKTAFVIEANPTDKLAVRTRMQLPKGCKTSEGIVELLKRIGHDVDTGEDFVPGKEKK